MNEKIVVIHMLVIYGAPPPNIYLELGDNYLYGLRSIVKEGFREQIIVEGEIIWILDIFL